MSEIDKSWEELTQELQVRFDKENEILTERRNKNRLEELLVENDQLHSNIGLLSDAVGKASKIIESLKAERDDLLVVVDNYKDNDEVLRRENHSIRKRLKKSIREQQGVNVAVPNAKELAKKDEQLHDQVEDHDMAQCLNKLLDDGLIVRLTRRNDGAWLETSLWDEQGKQEHKLVSSWLNRFRNYQHMVDIHLRAAASKRYELKREREQACDCERPESYSCTITISGIGDGPC